MKVALYARVSSDRQDVDLSIEAQLRALRDYAARSGHQVIREFVDEAETGRSKALNIIVNLLPILDNTAYQLTGKGSIFL